MSAQPTPAVAPSPRLDRPRSLHQPFVHDLAGVFHAPVQWWSAVDGSLEGEGTEGIYCGDTRVLSALLCAVEGAELSPLGTQVLSAREIVLRDAASLPDGVVDPILTLERRRTADPGGVSETLVLRSDDTRPRRVRLHLALATDAAPLAAVKDPGLDLAADLERPLAKVSGTVAGWAIGTAGSARLDVTDGGEALHAEGPVLRWSIDLEAPPRGSAEAAWRLALHDPTVPFTAVTDTWPATQPPAVDEDPEQRATARLLQRSLADLDALRLQTADRPEEAFLAAGAPWFFTLFGRDSLIAASLLLPVDTALAAGTLRTLASRQGTEVDAETAQQPGKILHEVRAQGMEMADSHLPPVYYGTIDATPLWIELLHDTLAAGAEDSLLTELRPALEAAATWLLEHADADGDGLLEYIDETGHGLANQGWKDSGDSIRFADGSLAEGTIALAEVQGYAYAAALHAAALLERGDEQPTELPARLRAWAATVRERFQEAFWCEDELGPYPALALDGAKRPVDGVASNMGHLLGTGILDAAQERTVVERLLHPSMFSGYGVRTLSTTNGGFGPLRYHGGSVWTHDTGYILRGMLRAGFPEQARVLARGLLRAAEGFEDRLPELFGGHDAERVDPPLPYPASCRPQAWSAASAVPVAQALGVLQAAEVDVPRT